MCRQPRKTGLGRKAQQPESSGTGRASGGGAVFLTRHKEAIFCSWETRVVSENRGVALTGLALRDDIPEFLEELAAWLASDAAPEESLVAGRALAHVLQRLDAGLSLAQVMREYRLLREVIIEEVLTAEAAEQGRAGASDERGRITRIQELARLNAGLDVVLSQSVEHFVNERDRRAAAVRESAAQAMRESEAALKAANAQLMEVDRNKNEFLAVLSHELRNPLSPIVNSLYVLDHAAPEGAQAERAKQIIGRQVVKCPHQG